jgi:hypothetical protein
MKLLKIGIRWFNPKNVEAYVDIINEGTGAPELCVFMFGKQSPMCFYEDERLALLRWLNANSDDVTVRTESENENERT